MPVHAHAQLRQAFDPDAVSVISAAFEETLSALGADRGDAMAELVAKRIVDLAQDGETEPARLRDLALRSARIRQHWWRPVA